MKRFSALLLTLLILITSCSESAPQETEKQADTPVVENQAAVPETAAPLTELERRASVKDTLPERDYGGTEFRISTKQGFLYEIDTDELTGDLLNDALYDRNLRIEDRCPFSFRQEKNRGSARANPRCSDSWDDRG